jgi:general secretion pathway protein J
MRSRGFTLIELLVALSLLAVTSALAWRGIAAVGEHRDRVEAQRLRSIQLERLFAQLQADVDMLASTQGTVVQTSTPPLQRRGDALLLLRRPRLADGASAGTAIEVVRYQVQGGELHRSVLGRANDVLSLVALIADPPLTPPVDHALLPGAGALTADGWFDAQWRPLPQQQLDEQTAGADAGPAQVPRALRVRITLGNERSLERLFLVEGV